jgi:hypothetical protein
MIKFRTEIEKVLSEHPLDCSDSILILGSCFADHIGRWLRSYYLDVTCNPFGTLYNPESIALTLQNLLTGRRYDPERDLAEGTLAYSETEGRYFSFEHHGSLSAETPEALCDLLNQTTEEAGAALARSRHLWLTWGTSWVYERSENHRVVANCHKFPPVCFERRRLAVGEIVERWSKLLARLPHLHVVCTVSPIRYVKETLHGNQLSKSILLLASEELARRFPDRVEYLPIYELLMDDLRDYRFYAADLVHPSDVAVEVVRQYVAETLLSPRCRNYIAEVTPLIKALEHRPIHPESEAYHRFIVQNSLKTETLREKYSIFTLGELYQKFQERLSSQHGISL